MKKVSVLLSSYNGQKYIKEQLDSLLSQHGVSLNLVVRDDGSTDNTKEIIRSYQSKNPGLISIIEGDNIGWRRSFFELIKYAAEHCCDSNYFAFCDQDDIWLPNKLHAAVCRLEEMSVDRPKLYASNLYYYKDGFNYGLIRKKKPISNIKNCLLRNYATGCTIVFDDALLQLISSTIPTIEIAHDYWAYMVAVLCGQVFIDSNSYILYRQHSNNQIGSKSGFLEIWRRRLNSFKKSCSLVPFSRKTIAEELLSKLGNHMLPEAILSTKKIAYYDESVYSRIRLLIDNEYSFDSISNDFWLKLRILTGKL